MRQLKQDSEGLYLTILQQKTGYIFYIKNY
jgi:hypothetical protein